MIYDECGGMRGGRQLKAVIPGGSSSAVLTPDQIDVKMDAESLQGLGSMLGSGGVVVLDDTTCMVRIARNTADFYAHESCGQCTPCREGCDWIAKLMRGIEAGQGTPKDLDTILEICGNMAGKTICVFADGAAMPISAFVKKFRAEFLEHLEGRCSVGKFPRPGVPVTAH
jgi:NADH-quinone oxidoreductase subunit F